MYPLCLILIHEAINKKMKSHILATNVLARIDVPIGQNNVAANDLYVARLKRDRSLDSEGSVIQKKKNMALLNYCIPEA